MDKFPSLTIVLPAYNEEGNIEKQVDASFEFLTDKVDDGRVIVVDDGSTDKTPDILKELSSQYNNLKIITHSPNQGYGASLRDGFLSAETEWVFYTDSDNQFDIKELEYFFPHTNKHDAIVGFRVYRYDSVLRCFLSWGFNRMARILYGIKVRDVDCAFKLLRRSMFNDFTIESNDFFVDCELMAKIRATDHSIFEIGVRHYPRLAGYTTVTPSDIPKTLKTMFKIRSKVKKMKKELKMKKKEKQID